MTKKRGTYILWILYASFFASCIIHLYFLWTKVDLFEVDMSGHIASVASFVQGNYHYLVDTWFGGYISHLFYPPLEAGLTALVHYVSGIDLIQSYKVYLTIVLILYVGLIASFSRYFKKTNTKILFLLAFLLLLYFGSEGAQYFQGLTFYDFLVTGLTSEFLGAIFLWVILHILYKNQHQELETKALVGIALCITGAIASHIVVGGVALCLVFVESVRRKHRRLFAMLLIGLGMSSFVRLPSLVYKGQMIPGLIIEKNIDILIMFVGLLVLSLRRKDVSWTLTASIVMMSIVPFAIFLFQKYTGIHLLPKFHYTRFTIIALSFLIIVVVGAFDKKATVKYQGYIQKVLVVLLFVFMLKNHSLWIGSHHYKSLGEKRVSGDIYTYKDTLVQETETLLSGSNKRVLSVDMRSPIGFSFDALFGILGSQVQFVKGLFRESTVNNTILSSYLVNVFDDNTSSVVNSAYYGYTDCVRMQSFFENFVRDYNIGAMIAPDIEHPTYMKVESKTCYVQMMSQGTQRLSIQRKYEFMFRGQKHFLLEIAARDQYQKDFADVAIVSAGIQSILPVHKQTSFFVDVLRGIEPSTRKNTLHNKIYVFDSETWRNEAAKVRQRETKEQISHLSLRKQERGIYELNVDTKAPVPFLIRMNYFPGRKLYNENGETLPLFESPQGMIAIGNGKMILKYQKDKIYFYSYYLSLLSLCIRCLIFVTRKRVKK